MLLARWPDGVMAGGVHQARRVKRGKVGVVGRACAVNCS